MNGHGSSREGINGDMEGYIDIHSHILPGIDDGAENFKMSMEMLQIAQRNGIRAVILTPHHKPMHHNAKAEKIRALAGQLQEKAEQAGMEMKLYTGNEFYYSSEMVRTLEEGQACTMADSDYVLVEFGPMDGIEHIRRGIYQLLSAGYRPILAHAERYESVCRDVGRVEDLIAMGCYIQVNGGSILGHYGLGTKQIVRKLLKKQLVHFVATDAHTNGKRSPEMAECACYLEKRYGKEYMDRLLRINPSQIIANRYI